MRDIRKQNAFRLSSTLNLQMFQATDAFPADADRELIHGLRDAAAAVSQQVLWGCGSRGHAADVAFEGAMQELDGVGELVEQAEQLGYLQPDGVLELLETQTALLMQLILINQGGATAATPLPKAA